MTRSFKSIQPDRKNVLKENRNSHAFVTSAYDQSNFHSAHQPKATYKHIPQTFTTNVNHERALPTQRPTMGGKTISAIRQASKAVQMSCKELKLLSRRIDPHEPLSSPHASPSKPPLPIISKKRQRPSQVQPSQPSKITKIDDDVVQFVCEPCNKKYKTRNGYSYHTERCKSRPIEPKKAAVIQCICQESTSDNGTMVECINCNTWLHIKCVGIITNESSYYCPRCNTQDGTITLSELCQAESNDFNFISLFPDESINEESVLSNTQWEDEFTKTVIFNDWTPTEPPPPSLLFSDNSSLLDDFSSDLLSPTLLPQSDWLHFANFEVDFQPQEES